jgi:flagellar biosynthesis repressor protein FlbT
MISLLLFSSPRSRRVSRGGSEAQLCLEESDPTSAPALGQLARDSRAQQKKLNREGPRMPGLILKLRAHEQILVNGVVMENGDRNTRLIIKTPDARILRLRDAISPEEATTPVKRACYLAQLAVAGESAPEVASGQLSDALDRLVCALSGRGADEHLDEARAALTEGNHYAVLRALRKLLPIEDGQGSCAGGTPSCAKVRRRAGTPA